MELTKYKLSDLLTIKNGRDYKSLEEGNIPVFGSGGYMCSVNSYLYDKPSVLLPRKGTLSNIQYYNKGAFWTVDTCYYTIVNDKLVEPYYIYRYLRNLDLSGLDSGASIPSMTQRTYNAIKVLLPNKKIQHRIASILSTYDTLIENNTKRIRLLEKMAENLYKEWFVRFRFPGHEKMEMVSGLPKEWKVITANDRYEITIGKTPPRKETKWFAKNTQNAVNWLSISDMKEMFVRNTNEQLTYDAIKRFNVIVVQPETILLSFKLTVGRVAIASCPLCTNEAIAHFHNVQLQEKEYLYMMLKYYQYDKLGNTSAIGNAINSKIVKSMKLVLPNEEVLEKFHKECKPYFMAIDNLQHQNTLLARQRDLLLPRLMSGKLEVKEELLE